MMEIEKLISLDLEHIWHPCSQMKDYEGFPPIPIKSASGSNLYTVDGREIIDAISSWWCKSLGHGHPKIMEAVKSQMAKFEHIILANTCNETLAKLSAKLTALCPGLDKIFYADNGSTAVEIAMKMSLQFHHQAGHPEKTEFAALQNGYHGETILTLATGDCELYSAPYRKLLPNIPKLSPLPYVSGINDPKWNNLPPDAWDTIQSQLEPMALELTAIVIEPILQGAGGMKIYSPVFLQKLKSWCTIHNVHLITDEIMTGFGRTGRMFAFEHAGIIPDFNVISKGMTAGWGPMAAVLCSTDIYNAFYDDYSSGKGFMHSNTYTGYALTAAASLAALSIYEEENIIETVSRKSDGLRKRMEWVADECKCLENIRSVGYMVAADIIDPMTGNPFPGKDRTGYACYQHAVALGALLRPLGDTVYFLPPLNIADSTLDKLAEITIRSIELTLSKKSNRK